MIGATLFSGIGAPEVSMPHWRWPWHAEIEKFPSAVMNVRHPQSVNLGDVTADDFVARALAIGRPDVLVFGSPCQSYSVAGKRLGLDDPRGNLALIALGIIDRLRPTWFVFENVPGLLSNWSGATESPDGADEWDGIESSDFDAFQSEVGNIRYYGCWAQLDAQYAGLAQRRERLFFVGHPRDWRRAAAVLLEPESLCRHPPTRDEAREDVTHGLAPSLTASGRGVERSGDTRGQDPVIAVAPPISLCLNAGAMGRIDAESETLIPIGGSFDVAHSLRADGFDASEDGTGRGTPIVAFGFANTAGDTDLGIREEQAAPITTRNGDPVMVLSVALRGREGGGTAELGGETATALRASQGGGDKPHALFRSGVRRLMPQECEALQGFPRGYTAITYRSKPAADGPRYKAIGNSMAVPVIRWILNRIEWLDANVPEQEVA